MASSPDVPPFIGYVETTVNALRLIHAARQGVIPRITRRLDDSERRTMIKSGAVFVFCVQESQIKRWTDGLLWSPSRIVGNFLVYREINERTSGRSHKKPYPCDDCPTRSLTGKSSPDQASLGFRTKGGSDQCTFKTASGGLIKKTISVIVQESGPQAEPTHLHLISYYALDDILSGKLKRPSTRADIMNLYMPPHIFCLTTFHVPPKVEIGPDEKPRLVEAEDPELVDCKVENSEYSSIPASPTWLSQGSLTTSPVDNPFHGSSLYPLSSGHASASSGASDYAHRGAPNEKWPGPKDSMLSLIQLRRLEMGWSPSVEPALASGHTMTRRRDSVIQSDTSPLIHSQSRSGGLLTSTRTDKFFSSKFESLKSLISKRLSKSAANTELLTTSPIDSYALVSHSDHPRAPTGDPIDCTNQFPPGSTSYTPIANGCNVFPPGKGLTGGTVHMDRFKPLASSIKCILPPPSLVDATGQSRTHRLLQGTISTLKLIQQIVGLAPVPGLQSLVGVVLNISEVVNNKYAAEEALVELAQKAGSFMVTLVSLVEQGSVGTFSDPDSMNTIIEGLTKEMNRVLGVVNKISSQSLPTRLLLSDSDKATVDECNRQITLACGLYGIQIAFTSQKAITRIEAKLNQALKILQESNKKTTTAQRASTF